MTEPEDIRDNPELADHATVVYIGSWWFGQWNHQTKKPTASEFSRFIFDLSHKTRKDNNAPTNHTETS